MTKSEKIERVYNVPLRSEWAKVPAYKRAKKAVKGLREFLMKHMKSENVAIGPAVNELIWVNGIKRPPHHVTVKVVKDDVEVFAELESKFDANYKARVEIREKEEKELEKKLSPLEQKKAELQKMTGKTEKKEETSEETKEQTVEEKSVEEKQID